jgi:hypothetical protein
MRKLPSPALVAVTLSALLTAAPGTARADGARWSLEGGAGGVLPIVDGDLRRGYSFGLDLRGRVGATGERFLGALGVQIGPLFGNSSAVVPALKTVAPDARDFQGGVAYLAGGALSSGVFFLGSGSGGGMYASLGLGGAVSWTVPFSFHYWNGWPGTTGQTATPAPFSGTQGWMLVTAGIGAASGTGGRDHRIVRGELGTTFLAGGPTTTGMLGLVVTVGLK